MADRVDQKIVILGGGITGLNAAALLSREFRGRIVVVEKEDFLGGLASTLSKENLSFDLGSHRLHGNIPREVVEYIEETIGEKLLKRPRNGRLYFRGNYLNYPPDVFNLLKFFNRREIAGFIMSYIRNLLNFYKRKKPDRSFREAIIAVAGEKIYKVFYKDYAKKLWGEEAGDISADGAKKRIILSDFKYYAKTILKRNGYFFYPRYGIGDIAKKLEEIILRNNGTILKASTVKNIFWDNNLASNMIVQDSEGTKKSINPSILISTIPVDDFFNSFFNGTDDGPRLKWRGMRLLFVLFEKNIETEGETYYFPALDVILGRVSHIKKYSPYLNPSIEGTLLTIEIPSSEGDEIWRMNDAGLLDLCIRDLIKAGILKDDAAVLRYFSLKFNKVYPVYEMGWKDNFYRIYNKLNKVENFFTIGRGGLFLHCNIDHCIIQGRQLANFILSGRWREKDLWQKKVSNFLRFSARD